MPKVSVIIPVYGVEKYIERCARSLFEQTLDDIEYIFIDDCSPDKSVEILKDVLEEYPYRKDQVIIHRMEKNSGQAAVRKWGILNATGEYIIHCDSDDWVDVTMYETLYRKAKEGDVDVVACEHFDSDGTNHKPSKHEFKDDKLFMMFNFPTLWEKLVKRSLFTCNEITFPSGNMGEDKTITIQLLWFAEKWAYINKPLYYYYINPQSISNTMTRQKALERFEMARKNIELVETFVNQKQIKGAEQHVDLMKKRSVDWLIYALPDREVLNMYRHSFKGLPFRILSNRLISIKEKLHYYLLYFGLMNN